MLASLAAIWLNYGLFSLASTTAEECTFVRLDLDGGPMSAQPIYDQRMDDLSDSNICYAIAATQVYDAVRWNRADALARQSFEASSPIWTGILVSSGESSDQSIENGRITPAFNALAAGGGCVGNSILQDPSQVGWIEGLEFSQTQQSPNDEIEQAILLMDRAVQNGEVSCVAREHFEGIPWESPIAGTPELFELASVREGSFLLALFNETCANASNHTDSLPGVRGTRIAAHQDGRAIRAVNSQLDAGLPAAIRYCGNYRRRVLPPLRFLETGWVEEPEVGCPAHASVLVGRRFNSQTQQCEYLLRDSYGALTQPQTESGLMIEAGQVWFPEDRLNGFLLDVMNYSQN